ncbi:type IV secretory pathway TrbL component [Skermanella aerolata]|uniref:type IV secretion system protein n=1 Tax=Skermanella aerolata TaxID=393310 RepID=UPI003D19687F
MFSAIDQAYLTIQNLLNTAFPYLTHMVWAWFGMMCAWAVFLGMIEWLNGKSPTGMVSGMFLRLGIFVYLASVWKLVIDGLGNMALQIGLRISGATASAETVMSPSGIFSIGNQEASRVLEAKKSLCDASWTTCVVTIGDQLMMELLVIGIWICFAILSLSLIMAALTFKTHGLFAFILLPFSQVRATCFLTESAISGVIQGAIWLAFIAMVAGFGSVILQFIKLSNIPDMAEIISAFLVYLFIGVMGWQSRSFAQGIVTGTTRIGGEALTAAARNTLGWATGTYSLGKSVAMAMEGPVKGLANVTGNTVHAGRTVYAKATGRALPPPREPLKVSARRGPETRGSAWNDPPTWKQKAAAKQLGIDISGMTRGKASIALEEQGNMDPSWYKE